MLHHSVVIAYLATAFLAQAAHAQTDPLKPWSQGVRITTVLKDAESHSIHSYFNTSPESPDGRWVLLFTSTDPRGQKGNVAIVERASGKQTVLAKGVTTEDAHRAACQQWVSAGKRVAFHDLRDGEWVVAVVDIETGRETVCAKGRQLAFGQPKGDVVPLYGPHWAPGKHHDLELLNVATGEIRTALTVDAVRKACPDWIARKFGDRPISIFFPLLSPDGNRVIFKVATPLDGGFQTKRDSERDGIVCFDLRDGKFLWMHEKWGHPAWSSDGGALINVGPVLVDAATGKSKKLAGFPAFPGSHPSLNPDGRLFATDAVADKAGDIWSVVIGDLEGSAHRLLHRFENGSGANSWRRSHPHPSFSADGKRLYFNASSDRWTRLYVAQCGE